MSFEVDAWVRRGGREVGARFASDARLVGLFGPSGAGKTSLLQMAAGLLRPARGRIRIAGQLLFDAEAGVDVGVERRRAGYIFQDGRLFPHRRVAANLRYGERLAAPADRWIGYDEVVAFLDLGDLLDRWPASLSGGEAQRVAIGRALLSAPAFLLMDEPLSHLDGARREEMLRVVERIRDALALPILYVSHDRAELTRLAAELVPIGVDPAAPAD